MIIFRLLNDPIPPNWHRNVHWQVEYYPDAQDVSRPDGIAWVSVFGADAYLDYVLVCDESRRTGVATLLIEAIMNRWSDLIITDGISPEGESLCKKFCSKMSA